MNPTVAVPCAVMVHVPDQAAGFAWYRNAFPEAKIGRVDEHDFDYLQVGEMRIEVVAADDKVCSGAAGSVIYWQVQDMDHRVQHLLACGAVLYRGPMNIELGLRMCQVRHPWGNCIGIRGK
jgi:predicted enzyme related to lactoylglutathione lyase